MKNIHTFDNGIKVYDHHLLENQRERYKKCNVHEEDEEGIFREIVSELETEAVYISIGTAIGYYPLLINTLRKDIEIHCFEPLPRHLLFLRENFELNQIPLNNIQIHDVAISTGRGEITFYDKAYGSSIYAKSTWEVLKKNIKKRLKSLLLGEKQAISLLKVKSIPLEDIFKYTGKQRVDFVQMDIQGFEEEVIEHYFSSSDNKKGTIDAFLIGTHSPAIHRNCTTILRNNNYRIEIDDYETKNQPDGILFARKN